MLEIDKLVQHQVDLERYKAGLSKWVAKEVNKTANEVFTLLSSLDSSSSIFLIQLNRTLDTIDDMIDDVVFSVERNLLEEVRDLLESEFVFLSKAEDVDVQEEEVEDEIPIILASTILGLTLSEHFRNNRESLKQSIRSSAIKSATDNLPINQIARGVRGTRSQRYKDGVFVKAINKLAALVSTAIQNFMTRARARVWDNIERPLRYQWISVLDSKTTPICRARSNKIYIHGEGPLPPAHFNCRSTIRRWEKGMESPPSYSEWLRRQPRGVVEDILGKKKAELFLKKKISLDKFITPNGRELTLEQLKARLGSA